jgi:hypothetical protein
MKFFILSLCFSHVIFASSLGVCSQGFDAFKKHVYPTLRAKCVNCHDDGADAPEHSSKDILKAYNIAKESVDFKDIEESYFLTMIDMEHWESEDSNATGMSYEDAKIMLNKWNDEGEKDCTDKVFSYVSEAITLSQSDLKKGKKIRFDLSNKSEEFKDSFFEIEVKNNLSSISPLETNFLFTRPRLTSKTGFNLKGFYIFIDNKYNSLEDVFSNLNTQKNSKIYNSSSDILPGSILSTKGLLAVDNKSLKDVHFSIGFDDLHASTDIECSDLNKFKKLERLVSKNCIGCHGDKGSTAFKRLDLTSNTCGKILERTNKSFWSRSIILDYAVHGAANHVKLSTKDMAEYIREFKIWAKTE